jgi:myo-inositol-1(or 4)-monophosphatase
VVAPQQMTKIIAGVIYEINRDECFHAIEGKPAHLNNEITVSKDIKLQLRLVATGFPT